MADPGAKQQSTNEPLESCGIGHDYAGRNIFLYGLFFLCVSSTFVVLQFVTILFLQYAFLGCFGWFISIFCAAVSLILLIAVVWGGVYRLRHVVCLFWAIFVFLLAWPVMPKFETYIFRRQFTVTKQTILQLVSEIESLRSQTHRLPENESELVELRGKSMPLSWWRTPLKYIKEPNEAEYLIEAYSSDYIWVVGYSSRNPDAGVRRY